MSGVNGLIARLAAQQHGVVSLAQIVEQGGNPTLVDRRLRSGHWQRAAPSVYRIGAAPVTFYQRAMAAVLSAGPHAVVSHRAALHLWGLTRRRQVPLEISIPRGQTHRRRGVVVHRSRDLDRATVTLIEGVPVTGLARTLLDAGQVQPHQVRRLVMAARRTHGLSWEDLLETLVVHGRRGRPGLAALRVVVAQHYGERASDSGTEDLAYELLVDSGLVPTPEKQVPILCADGVKVTVDFGWPQWKGLLEIYGVDHLTNEPLQHLDLHRRNQIELAGYGLLVYTGTLLRRRPDQFIQDTILMLEQRGWRSGHSSLRLP